jgi:lysophospholipase L1-like esterase
MHAMLRLLRTVSATLAVTCGLLVVAELLLRLLGYPERTFAPLFPPREGLYPESSVIRMNWGSIPYVVRTNALGLRGEPIERRKSDGTLRIVTIGDSVTDGFFVDNEATWQYVLEERLETTRGRPVEVVNCARGGGSIDRALVLLRRHGLPLRPDVVVLTFVTNDVKEILGKTSAELTGDDPPEPVAASGRALNRWVLTRTAVGEAAFDAYLKVRSPSYRKKKDRIQRRRYDDSRYAIPGGEDYENNAAAFLERFRDSDGLVLGDTWDAPTAAALVAYRDALSELASLSREGGATLVFVYCPAYSQVYGRTPSRRINEALRGCCRDLGIAFVDLTDGFVRAGRQSVLHLAPLDYHFNPAGNRVFAELLTEPLLEHDGGLLAPRLPR